MGSEITSSVRVVTIDSAAVAFVTVRLAVQTGVTDVYAPLEQADPGFMPIDSRGTPACGTPGTALPPRRMRHGKVRGWRTNDEADEQC